MKKCQISMQYLVMIGVIFLLFVIFIVGFAERYRDIKMEKERVAVKDLALRVHDEISIAHNLEDGYERNFTLPDEVEGVNYSITLSNNVVAVQSQNTEYSIAVAPVEGDIHMGSNIIKKSGGRVCLGASC